MKFIAKALIGAIFFFADLADSYDKAKKPVLKSWCHNFGHQPTNPPNLPHVIVCKRCGHIIKN
jgi:hypothetical protein